MSNRGQGLISVVLWVLAIMLSLWIFMLILGHMIEPIREFVINSDAIADSDIVSESALNNFWAMLSMWAPMLLGVGVLMLAIIYSVFREQFQRRRRVP